MVINAVANRHQKAIKREDDAELSDKGFELTCAWCLSVRYTEEVGSYSPCMGCDNRSLRPPEISPQEYDRIPIGLLTADASGQVLDHDDSKRRYVIGKNLFTSVACTARVNHLSEWFHAFLSGSENDKIFSLPFRLENDEIHVQLLFWRICSELSLVRIWVTRRSSSQ